MTDDEKGQLVALMAQERNVLLLLGEAERKNGWTLAEAAGEAGPQGMQRLLNFYAWDADGVRDDVRAIGGGGVG